MRSTKKEGWMYWVDGLKMLGALNIQANHHGALGSNLPRRPAETKLELYAFVLFPSLDNDSSFFGLTTTPTDVIFNSDLSPLLAALYASCHH
ncbi:hypothetical protein BLOT_003329 [Blomia tropicalis]|nr:hypothetical protein BLOT_003329 [Blomia tropicalis]